jgi:hypothetical protein
MDYQEEYGRFMTLVKDTRATQKEYFKYRRPSDMEKAKKLERQIDAYIAAIEAGEDKQADLFGG